MFNWDPIHDYSHWKYGHEYTKQGLEESNKHEKTEKFCSMIFINVIIVFL